MSSRERGTIQRITVDLTYPDGQTKQAVIEGPELEGLSALVLTREGIAEALRDEAARGRVLDEFDHGRSGDGSDRPAMMLLYGDQTYTLSCDPTDHRPHNA